MRGESEPLDIEHRYIRHIRDVHVLTITGGEPSLNVPAIRYLLRVLKEFQIHVYTFYIVTNGSATSMAAEFIDICKQLYSYQERDEVMLEMSDDIYHDTEHADEVLAALKRYPFFGLRGECEKIYLLREGRCRIGASNPVYGIYLTDMDYVYGDVYLNAEGKILSNGNLSYQRQVEHELCTSGRFVLYLRTVRRWDE